MTASDFFVSSPRSLTGTRAVCISTSRFCTMSVLSGVARRIAPNVALATRAIALAASRPRRPKDGNVVESCIAMMCVLLFSVSVVVCLRVQRVDVADVVRLGRGDVRLEVVHDRVGAVRPVAAVVPFAVVATRVCLADDVAHLVGYVADQLTEEVAWHMEL